MDNIDEFLDEYMLGEKPAPRTFPFSLYYSVGTYQLHRRQYEKASANFDMALKLNPNHVRALLKRCQLYLRLQRYEEAKADAEAAQKLWPEYSEAADLVATCQYHLGDFEGGYLTYNRERQVRPTIDKLRLGQQLCEEAIDNSLREKSGMKIGSRDLKLLREKKTQEPKLYPRSRNEVFDYERFAKDKKVLGELLSDGNMKPVHGLCEESLNVIKNNERFWAMQMPLHTRRKKSVPRPRTARRESVLKYLTSMKSRCQSYLGKGLEGLCISEGKKLLGILEFRPELLAAQKMKLKADVYHLLSLAYEKENKESLCVDQLETELEISQTYGLVQAEIRSLHQLGKYHLQNNRISKAYYCAKEIQEALKSVKLKKYLEDCGMSDFFEQEKMVDQPEVAELQGAKLWSTKLMSVLKFYIRKDIIIPSKTLISDLREMILEVTHSEHSTEKTSEGSLSDTSKNYYTANESTVLSDETDYFELYE